jgi:hypothetical protein
MSELCCWSERDENAYRILVWTLKGKRSCRRTHGLEDSVKMDRPIKEMLHDIMTY